MNVAQLKQFCRGFTSATETLWGEPSNFLVYAVGGKKFAYFKTSNPERWRFSMRVTPDRFIELTDIPGVKPARYRGRYHWVTIVAVDESPSLAPIHASYSGTPLDDLSKTSRLETGRRAMKAAIQAMISRR
jgi:predicted DNA-binding protein (MmcQ/YjbR family)